MHHIIRKKHGEQGFPVRLCACSVWKSWIWTELRRFCPSADCRRGNLAKTAVGTPSAGTTSPGGNFGTVVLDSTTMLVLNNTARMGYACPLLSGFSNTVPATIKNALIIGCSNPLQSVIILSLKL